MRVAFGDCSSIISPTPPGDFAATQTRSSLWPVRESVAKRRSQLLCRNRHATSCRWKFFVNSATPRNAGQRGVPPRTSDNAAKGTQKLIQKQPDSAQLQIGLGTQRLGRKDSKTVFVAGSTGRLGLRIVRQLLLDGFNVRAGARNTKKAKEYVELATSLGVLPAEAVKRLKIVSVDFEDQQTILPAIGNAEKVVQAIGAAESNVLDIGAPKRIDGNAAVSLVNAAIEASVGQYIMIAALGTGKFGWPAGALNLFGGILTQKRRAEKALEESGLPYVIIRPGGMERPTDDYKLTTNVKLATRDKLFGGQVSRLQVAELVSAAAGNPSLSANKVLEVVADSESPDVDYVALLQQHPSEISQDARLQQLEHKRQRQSRIEGLQQKLRDAEEGQASARRAIDQLQGELNARVAALEDVKKGVQPSLSDGDRLQSELTTLRQEAAMLQRQQEAANAVLNASKTALKEGKSLTQQEKRSIGRAVPSSVPTKNAAKQPRQQGQGFPSKQQEVLAEEISKQEIKQKLGKAGPEPTESEKQIAEGIAQKEIAIDTGKAAPLKFTEEPKEELSGKRLEKLRTARSARPPATISSGEERKQAASQAEGREARARREADFLKRLAEEQKQEENKKFQAQEKRALDARRTFIDQRNANLAKQEKTIKTAPVLQVKAPRKRSTKENAVKSKAVQPDTLSAQQGDAQKQAELNAIEAREWIEAWRRDQSSKSTSQNGSTSREGLATSQSQDSKVAAAAAGNDHKEASETPENVREARAWIRDWRARTLEMKLPQNSRAHNT